MILQVPAWYLLLLFFREGELKAACAFIERGFEKCFFAFGNAAAKVYTGMRLIGSLPAKLFLS